VSVWFAVRQVSVQGAALSGNVISIARPGRRDKFLSAAVWADNGDSEKAPLLAEIIRHNQFAIS